MGLLRVFSFFPLHRLLHVAVAPEWVRTQICRVQVLYLAHCFGKVAIGVWSKAALGFCRYRPCVSYLPAYVIARRLGCEACFHCSLEPWHVSSVGTFLEFVSAGTAASWFRAHFGWRLGFWAEVGRCVFAPGFERLRTSLPPRALGRGGGVGVDGFGTPCVLAFCMGRMKNNVGLCMHSNLWSG